MRSDMGSPGLTVAADLDMGCRLCLRCEPKGCGIGGAVGEQVESWTVVVELDATAVAGEGGRQSSLGTAVVVRRACFGMPALEAVAGVGQALDWVSQMGCKTFVAVVVAWGDQTGYWNSR